MATIANKNWDEDIKARLVQPTKEEVKSVRCEISL